MVIGKCCWAPRERIAPGSPNYMGLTVAGYSAGSPSRCQNQFRLVKCPTQGVSRFRCQRGTKWLPNRADPHQIFPRALITRVCSLPKVGSRFLSSQAHCRSDNEGSYEQDSTGSSYGIPYRGGVSTPSTFYKHQGGSREESFQKTRFKKRNSDSTYSKPD